MVEAVTQSGAVASTPWVRGRFDAFSLPRTVLFGRMYEDTEVERRVLPAGGRVLCIASAGDTARALAERHEAVVAVDINPVQLEYTRARLDGGPAHRGTAEVLMAAFRALLPAAGLGRQLLHEFLELEDPSVQLVFWKEKLRTRRLVLGMRTLLSLTGLKTFYASPFLAGLPDDFGAVMLDRLERCFGRHPNRTNPFARALFLGEAPPPATGRARNVELTCEDAAAWLERQPPASLDGFTLSNILDGAPLAYRERLFAAVARAARPGAALVLRSFAEPGPLVSGENLAAEDRSMIWGVVEVRRFP